MGCGSEAELRIATVSPRGGEPVRVAFGDGERFKEAAAPRSCTGVSLGASPQRTLSSVQCGFQWEQAATFFRCCEILTRASLATGLPKGDGGRGLICFPLSSVQNV